MDILLILIAIGFVILLGTSFIGRPNRGNEVSEPILVIDDLKNETAEDAKRKKDPMAMLSFGLGLASIFLAWIGVVPLLAVVFGAVGIGRTTEEGTGRGFAIAGLALGVVFFISNMFIDGHLGAL